MTDQPILSFSGVYDFLSNFYICRLKYDGEFYPSVEHAYQSAKTLDLNEKLYIRSCVKPGKAKAAGRVCTKRADWEEIKVQVMLDLLRLKFSDAELARKLRATGTRHLEEGNTWGDKFWGTVNGKGQNQLGKLLMQVRGELA